MSDNVEDLPEPRRSCELRRRHRISKFDSDLYMDYEFNDETFRDDPEAFWVGGLECYMRKFRCRIPKKLLGNLLAINKFIDACSSWEIDGFWR